MMSLLLRRRGFTQGLNFNTISSSSSYKINDEIVVMGDQAWRIVEYTAAGLYEIDVTSVSPTVPLEFLIVAGGGGGGSYLGGGGGGGGVAYGHFYPILNRRYTLTVGNRGGRWQRNGLVGENSQILQQWNDVPVARVVGGGGGGGGRIGLSGGCGGGAGSGAHPDHSSLIPGGATSTGNFLSGVEYSSFGHPGGAGIKTAAWTGPGSPGRAAAGGGGGAGGDGALGWNGTGGQGGDGIQVLVNGYHFNNKPWIYSPGGGSSGTHGRGLAGWGSNAHGQHQLWGLDTHNNGRDGNCYGAGGAGIVGKLTDAGLPRGGRGHHGCIILRYKVPMPS